MDSLGGASLRFDARLHEGDASSYAIGSLQIRCAANEAAGPRVQELLHDHRGVHAVLFAAANARRFVVGTMKDGGGEGSGYFETSYLSVDPRELCGT